VLLVLEEDCPQAEIEYFDDIIKFSRGDQTGEGSWKRKREDYETKILEHNDDGNVYTAVAISPTTPWFLRGGLMNKHPRQNWFYLLVAQGCHQPSKEIQQHNEMHPSLRMGLHYSLRWYWMGWRECRGIRQEEVPYLGFGMTTRVFRWKLGFPDMMSRVLFSEYDVWF
jgi:hypothetical protein